MKNVRLTVSLVLLALLVVFAVQNSETLQVSFLFWTIETRRVFILVGVLIVGIVLGWVLRAHGEARKRKQPPELNGD